MHIFRRPIKRLPPIPPPVKFDGESEKSYKRRYDKYVLDYFYPRLNHPSNPAVYLDSMIRSYVITDHLAAPGPLYWEYRCLVCSLPVEQHSFWGWLWRKIRRR